MCAGQELEVVQAEAPRELAPCQESPTHPKQAAVVCTAAKTDAEDQLRGHCTHFGLTVRIAGGRPSRQSSSSGMRRCRTSQWESFSASNFLRQSVEGLAELAGKSRRLGYCAKLDRNLAVSNF